MAPPDLGPFKTKPFQHQYDELVASANLRARALFFEQGTGKSWVAINTAAHLWRKGEIDALLVIAPLSMVGSWTENEVAKHLPDDVPRQCLSWFSTKAKSAKQRDAVKQLVDFKGLSILVMGYDALVHQGREPAKEFLTKRRCLYVLDEARRIKDPTTKRAKTILASAKLAQYRRVLDGTPVDNGPFDVFAPIKFLDDTFWTKEGLKDFGAFRTYFGLYEPAYGPGGRKFNKLVKYQRLDELKQLIKRISARVLKEDVLDLPPKMYTTLRFELSPEQRKAYDQLRDTYLVETESGGIVSASMAIVRLLRLQQITCGYVAVEKFAQLPVIEPEPEDPQMDLLDYGQDEGRGSDDAAELLSRKADFVQDYDQLESLGVSVEDLPGDNVRLKTLLDFLEDCPHQAIVWARFQRDIDKICAALGKDSVSLDGRTKAADRQEAIRRFQAGEVKFFVANPAAGGEGITLTAAKTTVFYNNSFKLTHRLQAEDRNHRIGTSTSIHYVDLVAAGTVDEHILDALLRKVDVASQVTGDRLKVWVTKGPST